ncbi:MAG TPA: Crp/Fnr family transcriptional regulator [Candidatus Acidoferrum sp.]|jgi:CRP/FNR family transcriptional regulator|nr:Crp/Fnr family transcriptional regulator [Candidatus Acidoferrum sp.]
MRNQIERLVSTLRRVALFNELSEGELRVLAERTVRKRYEAGAVIFLEGDECRELLIVEEGSVKLFKTTSGGRGQLMGIERAGNTVAEVPVFDGGRYSVTACAPEAAVLLSLDAGLFRRVCLQNPEVAMKVIKVLGHRLRHLDGLVEELSFSTVRGRLVAHLLRLAGESGTRSAHGVEFELKENNEELAARLGTVRELVSRNLGRLHGDGFIQMRKRTVRIADVNRLEKEVDPDSQE